MKLNKLFLIAGMALMSLSFASCSDDDDYTPGAETGKYAVSFEAQDATVRIPIDATEITFTVTREDGNGELTVPLNYTGADKEVFASLPGSVTFANGEKEKEVAVKLAEDMKVFTSYPFQVSVPEEYTNQYKETDKFPVLKFNVLKEDFEPWGSGVYVMWVFGAQFPVEISYSPYLKNVYRIEPVDLGDGDVFQGFNFRWSGKFEAGLPVAIVDSNGKNLEAAFPTGLADGTYGPVSMKWVNDEKKPSVTDIDENGFGLWFLVQNTVSLGSFGTDYDGLYITEVYGQE